MSIAEFPEKLEFLFDPHRYKVVRGGRASGKSWGLARALLILAAGKKLRILCTREIQNSIKDSVHKLLSDQIELLGLSSIYKITETSLKCTATGSEFVFSGLSSQTVESIKSFEGFDKVWIEEGQAISEKSFTILIPTIRKAGSEIWVSYNPELETDPTHQRFVVNPPHDCVSVEMNWRDNPFFNEVMDRERLHCLTRDPEGYKNIWDGECKPAVDGAIYYSEINTAQKENRICNIPYDPMLKVHIVMDLGWGDSLSIAFVQKNLSEIRIINYLEYSQTALDVVSSDLKAFRYNWGKVFLPHDGFNKTLNAGGKSTYDILRALGWDVVKKDDIVILSVEEGIRSARMAFRRFYFDSANVAGPDNPLPESGQTVLTHRLIESLKRYRRKISRETETSTTPVHDEFSHGADCFRYIAINADNMLNDNAKKQRAYHVGYSPLDSAVGY